MTSNNINMLGISILEDMYKLLTISHVKLICKIPATLPIKIIEYSTIWGNVKYDLCENL